MTPRNRAPAADPTPGLVRRLGVWDATMMAIGGVIGTGVFMTTGDIARSLPHAGGILLVWAVGGLLTLAGALTYAEMGGMYPHAGGIYLFLKEAYGPLWGFLYGWASFLIIMSGGIAAIAAGFGEYLGGFVPFFSTGHLLVSLSVAGVGFSISGGQLAAVLAIVLLTALNVVGVGPSARVQSFLTVLKIGAILVFVALGLVLPAAVAGGGLAAPLPRLSGGLLAAFGVGMIATLWTYDGWYGLTFAAGELRRPGRTLPAGLILGTLTVTVLYLLLNLVYTRALPIEAIAATPRIGEAAAAALGGPAAARGMALVILVSILGCLHCTILYSARIYVPMAADGVFFRSVARIHPRYRTPARSLWTQSAWAVLLTLSGRFDQLYTYVVFAGVLFHAACGVAVFVLRRKRPELSRPYRVWGYPVVPALFILASILLVANTLAARPVESLLGLGLTALGLPAYAAWRKAARPFTVRREGS